ncbi:phytanoyl-CoA dioxygenase family protein [Novosphingobium sp. BL-52-GroH]|uniref:phytanoyl-CoA dioxygenase family protein n=1 Tax=Novosphingobium sp. BL-52-GroH TaxID=3349877 RepID=UPI00384B6625
MTFALDRRTRDDGDCLAAIHPADFFADTLPGLLGAHGPIAAAAYHALSAKPLSLDVAGDVWTLYSSGETIDIARSPLANALVVSLSPTQFTDLAQNQITFNGLLVARSLSFHGGTLEDVSIWDSLWMAILEGWPVVDPKLDFRSLDGDPLDLCRAFSSDDDPAEIAHFLRETGFVLLRGWIDPADVEAISADMDHSLGDYREGDGKSWWADIADGSRVCVRLQEFVERSPTTAAILSGARWERMIRILEGMDALARKPVEGRIIEALFKPVGVVSGPSDLSFHRDCHLGRHSYACARMTVGIAITSASEANGQLRVIAGSHRLAMPVEIAKTAPYLPVVALSTAPGDVTVHLSCTLHDATSPVSAERRVLYTEIPLEPKGGVLVDTSVGHLRERVNDLLRDQDTSRR